jgi:ankyrin repeat protein
MQDEATPLWIACLMGHVPLVKFLLKAGADVDKVICMRKKVRDKLALESASRV